MTDRTLELPESFDPVLAVQPSFRPRPDLLGRLADEQAAIWRGRGLSIRPSRADLFRIALLLIDMQKDFCHTDWALPVLGPTGDGALQDCIRTAMFMYRNALRITDVFATVDTHNQLQVFFQSGWRLLGSGKMPEPHTLIGVEDEKLVNRALDGTVIGEVVPDLGLLRGRFGRDRKWLVEQMKFYVRTLEENARPPLYLWPYHCLDGTPGHDIMPVVYEAMLYHGFLRDTVPHIIRKGTHPLTEHYSIFGPEVRMTHDGFPLAPKETDLIHLLTNEYQAVIVAGEASSHCVAASLEYVMEFYRSAAWRRRPEKFYVLTDCMSPVVVPGADFSAEAEAALKRCGEAGMHLVQSTTPMEEWPDFPVAN
jgi:nicotinamidase-related amidase